MIPEAEDHTAGKVSIFGSLCSRTLRNRARVREKMAQWLRMVKGRSYPNETWYTMDQAYSVMLTPKAPVSLVSALLLEERVGEVPAIARITQRSALISVIKNVKLELEQVAKPVQKARVPPLAEDLAVPLVR